MQQGGALPCKPPIVSPWRYRLKNDPAREYPDEASVYAHLFDSQESTAVFSLMHRWSQKNPFGWPQSRLHGVEISSWKIYRSCVPDTTGFYCETQPEYIGYQRVRDVSCPPGHDFGSDPDLPYCLPRSASIPAVSDSRVTGLARR